MTQTPEPEKKLPVTAEVGGEGGSYADAAVQAATFSGPDGPGRIDPALVGPTDGNRTAEAIDGEQVRDDDAVVRHASEAPDEPGKA